MKEIKVRKSPRFLAALLLISFSIMAGFSVFLHDHEFDPFSADEDCAPCQWTHISVDLDSNPSSAEFIPLAFIDEAVVSIVPHKNFKFTYFGLSPPVFS